MNSTKHHAEIPAAQSPPSVAQDMPSKLMTKVRTRARKACLSCRARKVRCDVSHRGRSCTNCCLDGVPCVITGRNLKYRRALHGLMNGNQASLPSCGPLSQTIDDPSVSVTLDSLGLPETNNSSHEEECTGLSDHPVARSTTSFPFCSDNQPVSQTAVSSCLEEFSAYTNEPLGFMRATSLGPPNSKDLLESFLRPNLSSPSIYGQFSPTNTDYRSPEISFYCYPFLKVTNLPRLPQQDSAYLESQGCFKVPIRPFLDEMMQHYFLHIHPFLPLIDEGDFWGLYDHDPCYPSNDSISLLLLQSMLFSSCTFISESTIQALGYADIRSMRATFLRRAKSLYSLECESSPLIIAQACTLLTFTSLSSSRKPNTVWLSLAIEHAKLAEAHAYATMSGQSRRREQNALKRLWWCCIIRDRSISLLMRVPIHITKDQFDFKDPLTSKDLEDEVQRSKVYNPIAKVRLAEILSLSISLHSTLTDILSLVIPTNGTQCCLPPDDAQARHKLPACKASLEAWRATAASKLHGTGIHSSPGKSTNPHQPSNHESILLHTHVMYMYYHTARITLCHYEALHLDPLRASTVSCCSVARDLSTRTIYDTRCELQNATSDLTECHRELSSLGLVQWLPSPAIGFILLPLVLNILDVKLSPQIASEIDEARATRTTQQQLNMLIQFIKVFWHRYDGVEWVSEIIRHIVNLAQLDDTEAQHIKSPSAISWVDIFDFQPTSYLRLVLALDLSLRIGRLPHDCDFPSKLRGLFTSNSNPLKRLVQGTRTASNLKGAAIHSPQNIEKHNVENYALGLDECLVTILEDPFAFGESMRLADTADADSSADSASLSDLLEAPRQAGESSPG